MTLKPCPFCGGEAELQWVEEFYYCLSHVQCTACAARGQRSSNEAVAEEAWNTRIIPEGYVKVVLCRDCWKWGKDDCPVGDSWDDSDFCCYGEAKEDTNA